MARKLAISLLAAIFAAHLPGAIAQNKTATKSALNPHPVAAKKFTGDLDGMLQRRVIRALVVYSQTQFYIVRGRPQGIAYDALKAFESFINKKYPPKTKHLSLHVIFIPVARDQMLPLLTEGKGDIAVGALTVTPDRQKLVDFTEPTVRNISEIVVTGPRSPAIAKVDDLSGQDVLVRKSSSYWESLQKVNQQFKKEGKAEVKLRAAPEDLEDENLLEMLNAGLVGVVVTDDYKARLWAQIYQQIRPQPEVAVAQGREFAWAMRKNSPKFMAVTNEFVRQHRQGTTFGNILINKYIRSTKMIKNATDPEEMKKFTQMVDIFRKYAGQYSVDYLLMMAQGYQESQLNQARRSKAGAVGVMQLMPATGKQMQVGDIHQLEPNIHAGVKYVRFMEDRYFAGEPMDDTNKLLFSFAAYNAGPARVQQLRKATAQAGLNPNIWINNVEMIAAREIGTETVTYVSNIYKYYIAYKLIAEQQAERKKLEAGKR
ncbi:MAG TPA: lytic transglycosylase F [Candidatus Angelobacter sp.]|nr:lytic transglycosylase F [Candidatus Angelobacter sp.]